MSDRGPIATVEGTSRAIGDESTRLLAAVLLGGATAAVAQSSPIVQSQCDSDSGANTADSIHRASHVDSGAD